jgi:hypothetical protein
MLTTALLRARMPGQMPEELLLRVVPWPRQGLAFCIQSRRGSRRWFVLEDAAGFFARSTEPAVADLRADSNPGADCLYIYWNPCTDSRCTVVYRTAGSGTAVTGQGIWAGQVEVGPIIAWLLEGIFA